MRRYIDGGKEKELDRCVADLERKAAELQTLDTQIEVLEESIRAGEELLFKKQIEEREIRDNLKLRDLEEEVRKAKKSVCTLVYS